MTSLKVGTALAVLLAGAISASTPASAITTMRPAIVKVDAGAAGLNLNAIRPDKKTRYPICGVQFTYTLSANQTALFYTYGWDHASYIDWTVMNDTVNSGNPSVSLTNLATQDSGSGNTVTYWLTIENLTSTSQAIEARFCYLG